MAEVMVALAILAITMTGIALVMNKSVRVKRTADAVTSIKKIEDALEITYREAVLYVEQNCAGWGDSTCNTGKITPTLVDSTTLSVWLPTQSALKSWDILNCSLTAAGNNIYNITCPSGYGDNFTFSGIQNAQTAGGLYLNGYAKTPYTLIISVIVPGGTSVVSDTWSSGYLDAEYYEKTNQKILSVLRALKNYHFNKMLYEANNNICSAGTGGLGSNDDAVVPWIWQIMASTPANAQAKCTATPCDCTNFTNSVWTNNTAALQIDTAIEINTIMDNLGLDRIYRTDSFGNRLTFRLLSDRNGNALASVPSVPINFYANCLLSGSGAGCSAAVFPILPPFSGVAGVLNGASWAYSHKVVYAN